MSCPDEHISAWIDGELHERDARAVETHVRDCASCRESVASIRAMANQLRVEVEPDPGFIVRFRARRDQLSVAPWWTWRQLALRLVPVAAVVVLAAIAALTVSSTNGGSLQAIERDALGAPVAFETGPEAVLSIAFEPFPEEIE